MKVKQIIGCVVIVALIITLLISAFFYFLLRPAPVFETNDIADYGIIKGNHDNERPKEFVFSFFPKKRPGRSFGAPAAWNAASHYHGYGSEQCTDAVSVLFSD